MSESANFEATHVESSDSKDCEGEKVLVGTSCTVWTHKKWMKHPLGNKTIKQYDRIKDLEMLKRLVDFVNSITRTTRKCGVKQHSLLGNIVGEQDVTQCYDVAQLLQNVKSQQRGPDSFAQEYFHHENECCFAHEHDQWKDKNQAPASNQQPVINKTNSLDIMSIWNILEENNCFVDDTENEDGQHVNEVDGNNNINANNNNNNNNNSNNTHANTGAVDAVGYSSPTLQLTNDSVAHQVRSCHPAVVRDPTYLKNDNVDKNVKITALLIQLELAQNTINQQQNRIRDLHAEMGNKEKPVEQDKGSDTSKICKLENDLSEAMKLICAQTNQIKDNECLIEELKGSEASLQFELEVTKEQNNKLEESIDILRGVVDQLQDNTLLLESERRLASDCDVLILHDSFLKHIKTDLFEKQQLRISNVLCHHLSGALAHLQSYKIKPKVVIVHTGTNDIENLQVTQMCNIVAEIHACVTNNDMKLIISNITSTFDESELDMKVHLFNANISYMFGAYHNVTICKSNEPYDGVIIDGRNDLAKEGLSQNYSNGRTRLKKLSSTKLLRQKQFPYQYKGKENFNEKEQFP